MKTLIFVFFILSLVQCSSVSKKEYDSVLKRKSQSQQDILQTLREVSSLNEQDFAFISNKMKNVIASYKKIQSNLAQAERKINILLAEINLSTKKKGNVKVEVEEIAGDDSLFKESNLSLEPKDIGKETTKNDSKNIEVSGDITKSKNKTSNDSSFKESKKLFLEKSWQSAISKFQNYREQNPESLRQAEAIFYIAESFRELKMIPESKVFYKEILEKYPKSSWATKSKLFLKK